jgi:outer membrane protein OmpA-like peptidoglycan-associated protein
LLGTCIVADEAGSDCISAKLIKHELQAEPTYSDERQAGAKLSARIQSLRDREAAMQRNTIVVSLIALFLLVSASAFGDDKAEVKGMIIDRTGDTLTVRSADGNTIVVLTDETRTKDDTGLFGLGKDTMSNIVLIPGLKVDIDGATDAQGRVVAKTITVDGDDLETAEMVQSGLHPTAQQVAANLRQLETHGGKLTSHEAQLAAQKETIEAHGMSVADHEQKIAANIKDIEETTNRFNALTQFDVKGQVTLKFNVGSSKLDSQDEDALKTLAQTASGLSGYIIEVVGYADATGSAEVNTKLSEDRARAAITYLVQQGNIPVRHIVAPGAMGEYGSAATNETKSGRAENRRVEVKVLVNKGIAGS